MASKILKNKKPAHLVQAIYEKPKLLQLPFIMFIVFVRKNITTFISDCICLYDLFLLNVTVNHKKIKKMGLF